MKKVAGLLAGVGLYNLVVMKLGSPLYYANLIVGIVFVCAAIIALLLEYFDKEFDEE